MNAYFKDGNTKSKAKCKKHQLLSTLLKSVDNLVFNATKSKPATFSSPGLEKIMIPIITGVICGLTLCEKSTDRDIYQKKGNTKYFERA